MRLGLMFISVTRPSAIDITYYMWDLNCHSTDPIVRRAVLIVWMRDHYLGALLPNIHWHHLHSSSLNMYINTVNTFHCNAQSLTPTTYLVRTKSTFVSYKSPINYKVECPRSQKPAGGVKIRRQGLGKKESVL